VKVVLLVSSKVLTFPVSAHPIDKASGVNKSEAALANQIHAGMVDPARKTNRLGATSAYADQASLETFARLHPMRVNLIHVLTGVSASAVLDPDQRSRVANVQNIIMEDIAKSLHLALVSARIWHSLHWIQVQMTFP